MIWRAVRLCVCVSTVLSVAAVQRVGAMEPSAEPRVDASVLPRMSASVLSREDAGAMSRVDASAMPRVDASVLPRVDAGAMSRVDASAMPREDASAMPRAEMRVNASVVLRVMHGLAPAPPVAREQDPHFLMEYEAVRLFMDRAVRVNSGFRLTGKNATAVVDICRQLDGIPLAIEMAAARLRSFSVSEINTRLEDRFRLLTSGNRGVLPRQQTLRAAIDWSYDLLSEAERVLLCRLSVFAGGWVGDAVESVCGAGLDDVSELLALLVDKSLVTRPQDDEESVRYGMLETIRQYGNEHLAADGSLTEIRWRHLNHYLMRIEANRAKMGGPDSGNWLSVLDAEHDNIRQALLFCREEPEAGAQGVRLSAALWRFWMARGHFREGREQYSALLAHPGAESDRAAHAEALNGAGILAFYQGDFASAQRLHEEGLTRCRAAGDSNGAANALANLGNIAASQGDFTDAQSLYTESLAIKRAASENPQSVANLLNNLGNVAKELGDYDRARGLQEEGLQIERELGNRQGVATSLNNLGILAEVRGDYEAAQILFEESLTIHRELGPPTAVASNLAGLGNVALQQGDYQKARSLYEASLTIRRPLGDSWGIAISLQGLGMTFSHLGDADGARTLLTESLTLRHTIGDQLGIAESVNALASLAQHEGDKARSVQLWGAASTLREAIGAVLSPHQREELDRDIAVMRDALGAERFTTAWETGRGMTADEAIQFAGMGR